MTQQPPPPPVPGQPDVPDFVPPPQWAPPPLGGPAPTWSVPIAAPPQQPAPPPRRRRAAIVVVAALIVASMAAAALWITPRLMAPVTGATPAPGTSSQPRVVTVTPAPQPTANTVLTSGGDVGRRISFRTAAGAGTVTLTQATWSQAGLMAPPPGRHYLVVAVTITCESGTVAVNSLSLVAGTDPIVGTAFGPSVTDPLPGVTLTPGQKASGEVGFVIPADATAVSFLADNRHTAATIEVPGP